MSQETYGFIGLGNMGGPMSGRLLAAGSKVAVYDRDEAALARVVAKGGIRCSSPLEVADKAATIFLSLPDGPVVQHVACGPDGVLGGKAVKCVVDLSTIGPRAAVAAFKALAERNIAYVDSPVSGGVGGAERGTVAVMVACPRERFETLSAVLRIFGPLFYMGTEAGLGQTMKLANNLLSAAAVAITSEAMAMGAKAGLDPGVMLDVINAGSGRNSATMEKFPNQVVTGKFNVGFAARLAYKDVRLCVEESESLGVPMVVGAAVREMLVITNAVYGKDADYTDVARLLETWGGVPIRKRVT
jgi:3-hydroxyisobutyrate dehydrogenase-like beta-hydroxyacid dehydrogenase